MNLPMVFLSTSARPARVVLLGLALLLGACGSQMDNIDTPDVRPPSQAPAGIYEGTLSPEAGTPIQVTALVDATRIFLFDAEGGFIASGLYNTSDRNLNLQARTFERDTTSVLVVRTLTAQGGFDPEENILAAYTGDFGTGTLTLDYLASAYERRSDLPLLAGTWVKRDAFGSDIVSLTIGQSGAISGSDARCSYSGQVALIDQPYNLYRVSLASQCGAATPSPAPPDETGLAMLRRELDGSSTLVMVATVYVERTTGTYANSTLFKLRKS
jgi:hypothetical protein